MSPVKVSRFSGSQRRVEILEAALECFAEHGYDDATVEQIRERCGASNGSFYHFFPSKRGVAVALFAEYSRMYADRLRETIGGARTARAFVVSVATFAIRWAFEDEPDFAAVAESLFVREVLGRPDARLDPPAAGMRDLVGETYELWTERGAVKPVPPDLLHPILFGPAEAYVRLRLHGSTTLEPHEAATALGRLVWNGLRA